MSLHVNAFPAFGTPVLVDTTQDVVQRLLERLRAEPRTEVVALSNKLYRRNIGFAAEETDACARAGDEAALEAWQRFCGDVLVFYCARNVLDGREIPVTAPTQLRS